VAKDRWPPAWLAFYQTKAFGQERYSVRYYARILTIKKATRRELFPSEPENDKSNRLYYQLWLDEIQQLPQPILSSRRRRIVFIPTTWPKFSSAAEINDLYDDSPLEDRLWAELKRHKIPAERQEFLTVKKGNYALDFAIYCDRANVDVETDGDTWHANPEKAALDNLRDNALEAVGWKVLRFTTGQICEETTGYCIPTILETINKLGGVHEGNLIPRKINPDIEGAVQMGLFDDW